MHLNKNLHDMGAFRNADVRTQGELYIVVLSLMKDVDSSRET